MTAQITLVWKVLNAVFKWLQYSTIYAMTKSSHAIAITQIDHTNNVLARNYYNRHRKYWYLWGFIDMDLYCWRQHCHHPLIITLSSSQTSSYVIISIVNIIANIIITTTVHLTIISLCLAFINTRTWWWRWWWWWWWRWRGCCYCCRWFNHIKRP